MLAEKKKNTPDRNRRAEVREREKCRHCRAIRSAIQGGQCLSVCVRRCADVGYLSYAGLEFLYFTSENIIIALNWYSVFFLIYTENYQGIYNGHFLELIFFFVLRRRKLILRILRIKF